MKRLYELIVVGKEKAITGFIVSAILSAVALVGVTGDMTVKDAVTAVVVGVLTHLSVYYKSNS